MPPYTRTGRTSPLEPADIPRPDAGRDPGITARPVAQEVPQVYDPTGKAIANVAEQLGGRSGAYRNLASATRGLSADLFKVAEISKGFFDQRQDVEDRTYADRFNLEYNKKTAAIESELLNSPESGKATFIQTLDQRLAEAQKQTHDELTANGDYNPSQKGRQVADHTAMTMRAATARRAAVQAHNQRINLLADQVRNNVVEIAMTAAQTGDYTAGLIRANAAIDTLTGVLAPDKLRVMRDAARDVVVNMNVGAMDPYRRLNELRETPVTDDAILDRIGGVEAGGDPNARAKTSSALGLFQFIDSTWLETIRKHRPDLAGKPDAELLPLRTDPVLSREMAGKLLNENREALKAVGLQPTAGNLYLAHFLGSGSAIKVLQAPAGTPVADVVGQDAIVANRSILAGKTTDSVIGWAAHKMGGVTRGQGNLIDYVPEDKRIMWVGQANAHVLATEKKSNDALIIEQHDVRTLIANDIALTQTNGKGTLLSVERVKSALGTAAVLDWQDKKKTAVEIFTATHDIPTLSGPEIDTRLARLKPPDDDPDLARRTAIYNGVAEYVSKVRQARIADPAAYGIASLPAVQEAWRTFQANLSDPNIPLETRQQAAELYAARTLAEQERIGIPAEKRTVMPKDYIEKFHARLAKPVPAGGQSLVYQQIVAEQNLWGKYWPEVYQQIQKESKPVVRVLGAGVRPEAGALLVDLQGLPAKTILRDESESRWSELETAVRTVIKPFAATMVGGGGRDAIIRDYEGQIQKLTAHYIAQDGMDATRAARKAYDQLIGFKYDLRDTWRVPKDVGVPLDTIALGADEARRRLGDPADPILSVMPDVDKKGRDLSPEYLLANTIRDHRRNGKWTTASGDVGLMLIDGEGKVVRHQDGSDFILTWGQLQRLGEEGRLRPENDPRRRLIQVAPGLEKPVEATPAVRAQPGMLPGMTPDQVKATIEAQIPTQIYEFLTDERIAKLPVEKFRRSTNIEDLREDSPLVHGLPTNEPSDIIRARMKSRLDGREPRQPGPNKLAEDAGINDIPAGFGHLDEKDLAPLFFSRLQKRPNESVGQWLERRKPIEREIVQLMKEFNPKDPEDWTVKDIEAFRRKHRKLLEGEK